MVTVASLETIAENRRAVHSTRSHGRLEVSTNHAHACHPLSFMKDQAVGRETTVLAVFNLIRTGALPESKSDALAIVA